MDVPKTYRNRRLKQCRRMKSWTADMSSNINYPNWITETLVFSAKWKWKKKSIIYTLVFDTGFQQGTSTAKLTYATKKGLTCFLDEKIRIHCIFDSDVQHFRNHKYLVEKAKKNVLFTFSRNCFGDRNLKIILNNFTTSGLSSKNNYWIACFQLPTIIYKKLFF